jgi:hypothetical protein
VATYDESYCNTTTDLSAELPQVETFDRKRQIDRGRFVLLAENKYKASNTGFVGRVFRNGADLGAAQADEGAVSDEGEWYYDAAGDYLVVYSLSNISTGQDILVAPDTWGNIKTEAVARASERIRGYINKAILPRAGAYGKSESGRVYEDNIIRATAIYACALLAYPHDQTLGRMLEQRVYRANPAGDEELGLADQIKRGETSLWNELTARFNGGVGRSVAVNASTTGGIAEIRGAASVSYDLIKVKVITGGTFADAIASTVTYSIWIGDSTGRKTSQVVTAAVITGDWQALAHGLDVRFATGVYTDDDEWEVEVRGGAPEAGTALGSANVWRM